MFNIFLQIAGRIRPLTEFETEMSGIGCICTHHVKSDKQISNPDLLYTLHRYPGHILSSFIGKNYFVASILVEFFSAE